MGINGRQVGCIRSFGNGSQAVLGGKMGRYCVVLEEEAASWRLGGVGDLSVLDKGRRRRNGLAGPPGSGSRWA
jgi:hypothetical protein